MGPLVGDNFVRFLQGGALAINNHILKKKYQKDIWKKKKIGIEYFQFREEEEEIRTNKTEKTLLIFMYYI